MALSITQQAALLFKKLFGKAQTTTARDFFEEPFNAPPTVLTSQIWTDSAQIPLTASVSFTGSGHIIGVVQYLQDVSLTLVAGTSNSFQDNQLRDAIPFNYGNGSYNYAIKDSTSTAIPFGTNDWIVDTEGGVLTFYNSVPANMPPTITFYKYVGNKGLASASVNLANSASYAVTASYASNAGATNFSTGSYTGSFTGSLLGSSSYALSSSWAARSVSASYAGTDWNAINNKPTVISSSVQINTGSFTGSFTGSLLGSSSYALSSSWAARSVSASYAGTDWNAINNKPTVFSSSVQINTGSYTGSFTGSLLGSASYALTASAATSITFTPTSASYALSSSFAQSSSFAVSASWSPGSAGGDFNTLVNKPTLVSSSAQVNTGSFTGSFTGGFAGTASYALNAATASYISSSVDFPNGLTVTGSITASVGFSGSGANITGVVSSSYALTASYAMNGGGSGVSSSYALTSSYASYAPTALSASFATSALTASYMTGSINFTDGLLVTGSVTASVGYTGSFTGSLLGSASYALTSSAATSITFVPLTASYALSAGATGGGLTGDGAAGFVTLFNGTTSVTASVIQADNSRVTMNVPLTASFFQGTGSAIVGVISASYATTAVTASYVSGGLNFPNGLTVTGSVTASAYTGSFTGSLLGSSSYALSSSYAMSASWAPGGDAADFNTLLNKPTLVSSSAQVNTGSFTGSFTGNFLGSASYATMAATASYISGGLDLSSGLVVTGSVTASIGYTGSFTGSLLGSSSYALSSSYAMSASWAPGSAGGDFNTLVNKPTLVSSSAQINTGSFTGSFIGEHVGSSSWASQSISSSYARSASYAGTDWNAINNKPVIISASAQINTGSFTGSFTGGFAGTASYAFTSWADINNKPIGILSSSAQINLLTNVSASWASRSISASYAGTDWNAINNRPVVVSSSAQVSTGSYTGSFTGGLLGSASYAPTSWVDINNKPVGILSGSTQINLLSGVSSSWASQSLSSSYAFSSSYAVSASWAPGSAGGDFNTLVNKPTLVSSSAQVNTGSFTGSFTGNLLGSASYATTASYVGGSIASASYAQFATSASYFTGSLTFPAGLIVTGSVTASAYTGSLTGSLLGSASYALSASWAPGGGAADFNTLLNKPTLVSSSAQVNTGSFTGSFIGDHIGSSSWASHSISSSYARSASYAGTDWNAINNKPIIVSSSAQVNTGSFTGSFTGNFLGSASFATTSSYATSTTWNSVNNKPTVVSASAQINTGSFTGSFTGGLLGSASYAPTSWVDVNNKPVGILSGSTQINLLSGVSASWASQSLSSSYAFSSSYAVSASWSPGSAGGDFNTLVNKPTLVSSSAQVNTGSFTGSFTGNFLGSASYATMALTASYVTGTISFPNGLTVTGSVTASAYTGSFTGSLLGSASYALSSSYAMSASWAPGSAGGDFNTLVNKPTLVSSSAQVNTGSFTGSFTGGLLGTASYANTAATASYITASIGFPNGLIVTGSVTASAYTGSLTGSLLGSASYAINAATASSADRFYVRGDLLSYGPVPDTSNMALGSGTLASVLGILPGGGHNTAIGLGALNKVVSGTLNTAIGHEALFLNVSGTSNTAIGYQALYQNLGDSNVAIGQSTLQNNRLSSHNIAIGTAVLSSNSTGSFNTAIGTQAMQLNTSGSESIAFGYVSQYSNTTGNKNIGIGNWSLFNNQSGSGNTVIGFSAGRYETGSNAFYINNIDRGSLSVEQSTALLYGGFAATAATQFLRINAQLTASQNMVVLGGITGSLQGSSSYALSSSYAVSASWAPTSAGGDFNTLVNKPTLVSSSAQVNTGSFTGSFTGNFLGSASYATMALTASYMTGSLNFSDGLVVTGSVTASAYTGSFTGSLLGSSSYATMAATASYISGGLDLSSGLVVTGSVTASIGYTGSFTGSLLGSSSYALSSSYAMSASWAPGGGAGGADWNTNLTNIPIGLVSSSVQVSTGSFTGSYTGAISASEIHYDRATVRYQILPMPTAGNYTASITLSLGQHIYMTGSGAIGNTRWIVADEVYNRTDGFILTIASGGIRTHTWPKGNADVSASWPGGVLPTLTPSGGWDTIVFTTTPTNDWDGVVVKRDSK